MRCKVSHLLHAYTRDIMAEFKLPKNSQIIEGDIHPEPQQMVKKKFLKFIDGHLMMTKTQEWIHLL